MNAKTENKKQFGLRTLLLISVVLFAAGAFSGCSSVSKNPSAAPAKSVVTMKTSGNSITLTVTTMDGSPCTVLHGDAILSEVPGTGTPQTISGIDSDKEIVIKGKGIQILHCNDNKLNALELNAVPNLTELYCQDNQLTSLNVSGLDNLITLYCYGNKLPSLSVKGLNKLTTLYCYKNQMPSLDVSGLPNLTILFCGYNQLTSLNISNVPKLNTLRCYKNTLTADAFKAVFEAFPQRDESTPGKAVIYLDGDENSKVFNNPSAELKKAFNGVNAKHWTLYHNGDEDKDKLEPYSGL
ncbi:hypothetical protein DWQ65_09350 [Treponema phagedenis]|uniref:Leucine Rich Repeat protein n=1 Tax=Treponema phagedenis TaxID=162 RepID=A0A0B7H2V0_TREPH|nr:leucine-rich repeat domain-containing protein [Treponema phagedenis]NVP24133.1 leucine-rich repeat domain-containing protein [Treponema phagedenis]QEJ96287.1 hypothetical protein FUT79_14480 [Treponema phagedenis]QEJ99305.1 hypothetical protein FUT82_15790 [Treponema phagedenis]QEK00064.1 hypothetical protein FUT84_01950 [Treponema phagedenis]QEK04876.1 hypothetical protein FUT83_14440 [Treponema phagedenis]